MYHPEFQKAKNSAGKFYRNQETGDLVEYCGHSFLAKPVFEFVEEPIADGAFSYLVKQFSHFELVCGQCGECFTLWADSVMGESQFEYKIGECAKEVEKEAKGKKK